MDKPLEISHSSPLKCLLTILNMGGEITTVPNEISTMLNGLRYYSLEVTMDQNCYNIQGYEQEAVDLYNIAMTILSHSNTVIRSIENRVYKIK